jgi:hypothetical protein
MSESKGICNPSTPPSFLGVFNHAKCENCESVEMAIISALIS